MWKLHQAAEFFKSFLAGKWSPIGADEECGITFLREGDANVEILFDGNSFGVIHLYNSVILYHCCWDCSGDVVYMPIGQNFALRIPGYNSRFMAKNSSSKSSDCCKIERERLITVARNWPLVNSYNTILANAETSSNSVRFVVSESLNWSEKVKLLSARFSF